MENIEVGKPYVVKFGGEQLAKVLYYYGIITDMSAGDYKIVCPFHGDINPSMVVNIETGTFFCFGCGRSGNAFDFVCGVEKDYSIKTILKYFRILKSERVEAIKFKPRYRTKKASEELYNIAYDYYYGLSRVNWSESEMSEVIEARKYMKKRGFTAKTLNKCQAKVTYNKQYGIIFPMLDNGVFKGWVCRTMIPEVEKKRKYLYNSGFMRRTTLVGNYAGCEYVFVVEGYMDRLKFVQFGVENVVAILGWKMSREQEKKLKDAGVKYIISALDNDTCGKKGTEYLKNIFRNVIRFQYLKGIKDPGEMTKDNFERMLNKTMTIYEKEKQNYSRRKL